MQGKYFQFLDGSIRILIADDEPAILDIVKGVFIDYPIYEITKAGSAAEAVHEIKRNRIHLCLMDLGLKDIEKDEYFLLRNYSDQVPVVVFSSQQDLKKGAESIKHGAKAVLTKDDLKDFTGFLQVINPIILRHLFERNGTEMFSGCLQKVAEANVYSVTQWAKLCDITEVYLRKICQQSIGLKPKEVLAVFNLFSTALSHCESCIDAHKVEQNPEKYREEYVRMEEYYHFNKNMIVRIFR